MRMIPELLETLGQLLPVWLYVPLLVVLAAALVPAWLFWLRSKQIKGQLRRMVRERDPERRAAHRARAFHLAAGRPRRLVGLADEAHRVGLKNVFDAAVRDLAAAGGPKVELDRLRKLVTEPPKRGAHPLEELVIIERMWDQGLHDAARARLTEVRARFPDDPDLATLEARLYPREAANGA